MMRSIIAVGTVAASLFLVLAAPAAVIARSAIPAVDPNDVNRGVVEVERAATEFALNHNRKQAQAAAEDTAPPETGISDGTEDKDPLALAPTSR
jgi:hypothetical protein